MEEKAGEKAVTCNCPYCDAEIECLPGISAVCQPCSITIITCEQCGGKMREGAEECPECGEKY